MNAVATVSKPTRLEQVISEVLPADRRDDFYRVLPRHISPERFERAFANVLMNTPEMMQADPRLIFREISKVVGLGLMLDPQLGEAYLILGWNAKTRQKEPQVRIGYKGLIKLAKQSGEILNIYAREVHEKDEIECLQGDENRLIHKPKLFTERGPVVGYYAVVKLRNGEIDFEPMSVPQIHEIRDRSDGWKAFRDGKIKSTPWATDEGEMSKKTVLRRLQKRLTQSPDLVAAVAIEDSAEFSAFDKGRSDVPPAPRRVAPAAAPRTIEHQPVVVEVEDVVAAVEMVRGQPAATDAAGEADEDGVVSKGTLLTDLDDRLSYAKTVDEVEEAYTDFDAEALLSDYEGGVEAARKLKAQHLDRVPAPNVEKKPESVDDFPGNEAIAAAQSSGVTVTSGGLPKDPFAIPERFKGGGHYQIWIGDAVTAATTPEHAARLRVMWSETKQIRAEFLGNEQLVKVTTDGLLKQITEKVQALEAQAREADDDIPSAPRSSKAAGPAKTPAPAETAASASDATSADPVAAYTAKMEEAFGKAQTEEEVDRWWFSTTDERDEQTGASEEQRTKWRLARSKAKNALPSEEG